MPHCTLLKVTPTDAGYLHQDQTEVDFSSIALEGTDNGTFLHELHGTHPQDTIPHSSQGQEPVGLGWASSDLEEPDYLIRTGGAPNTE